MTLKIGNKGLVPLQTKLKRLNNKMSVTGFTLVEIMVATAVLSLGIVMIYEAMFVSLDVFEYYRDYMQISSQIDQQIWEAQAALSCFGSQSPIVTSGVITTKNKSFSWNISYGSLGETGKLSLYKMVFTICWRQGKKNINLSREAYALYKAKQAG